MTKFMAFDDSAIEEVVSGRIYQSIDFGYGKELVQLIKGLAVPTQIGRLAVIKESGGVFIVSPKSDRSSVRFFVIDLEQSGAFSGLPDQDALFAFQKVMRFARKWWAGGQGLTYAEKIISGTSKAVVFPFRYQPQPYRAVIEREPWKDRLAKRGLAGRFLLLYKAGYSGGDSAAEEVENTNFKKVVESFERVLQEASKADLAGDSGRSGDNDQLRVTDLASDPRTSVSTLFRSFDEWMIALTDQQRNFITAPLSGAHRIEGAAGTGKTLSLVLKAVYALRLAEEAGVDRHIVFITHSEATRASISDVLSVVDSAGNFQSRVRDLSRQSLTVTTLTQLCSEKLHHAISESEFIDRDAMESKGLQRLYIAEAIEESISQDLPAHSRFMSPELVTLMQGESSWYLSQIFQHEISVLIKGRAAERFEVYRDSIPIKYGLPAASPADKAFAFAVFKRYRDKLAISGQFDTDDVVLTAIGQLDTPIWKRRRLREGFDAVFIDETHLFNINELHLFHYFTKGEAEFPIAYSIDKSQAVGDPGWSTLEMEGAVSKTGSAPDSEGSRNNVRVGTIFRSSPEIVDLAFCIVSSGATLFTNFENPIGNSSSAFTSHEEGLSKAPVYIEAPNEDALVELAFERVDEIQKEMGVKRAEILVCTLDEALLTKLSDYGVGNKRPLKVLSRRGDVQAVDQAMASGMYMLGHADYVGGLEFAAVVLVGVDDGRVPPVQGASAEAARHFLTYAAHNRLYVAVTRAKYRVEVLGEAARGISRILAPAVTSGLLRTTGVGEA